jgi:hypothetical protein
MIPRLPDIALGKRLERPRTMRLAKLLPVMLMFSACGGESAPPPPLAEKQAPIQTQAAKEQAVPFTVASQDAQVTFAMEAPLEKQDGEVPATAVSGELQVDLEDLTKTTGLVNLDISDLVIYQQKAEKEGAAYGERIKSDVQNEHMRDWLEIGEDAPAAEADKNKLVQFALGGIEDASQTDIRTMSGPERTVSFVGVGEFRLHQRVTTKRVKLEATFHFEGDAPTSVDVRTVEPFLVGLAEHDVRPRTAFGKLASTTLEAISPKVGKEAEVSVAFTAKPKP